MADQTPGASSGTTLAPWALNFISDAWSYAIDAFQRSVLLLDVLHQRSVEREKQVAKLAPHVLKFGCELIVDGRTLPRPVNYVLVRIRPPAGVEINESKRPFVIVDPELLGG
jgi:hypothetical protein